MAPRPRILSQDGGGGGGGGGGDGSSSTPRTDAGVDGTGDLTAQASLVLVNGLVGGGQKAYDDVRVCIDGVANPLPDAVPMPMSNYPGVARGTGVDLGKAPMMMTLRVFHARNLSKDAAWAQDRISCDSWAASYPPTLIPVTLSMGPTLAVLVDDPTGPDGIQVRTGALPGEYKGSVGAIQLVAAEFSTFARTGESLRVTVSSGLAGSGTTGVLANAPYALATSGGPIDGDVVRFERLDSKNAVTASFDQTLGSVQFLSDPTTTPSTYFDRRTNFALVLLGDATSPVSQDEKDLHFDGKGLHAVAVPYAAVPQ